MKSFPTLKSTAAATAGSADADMPTSGSVVFISGGDDNLTALKSATPRLDMVHPTGSEVHIPDSATVTAKSAAGLPPPSLQCLQQQALM